MITKEAFKSSLAGVYYSKERLHNINDPGELLTDYENYRVMKKNWYPYIEFLKNNQGLSLKYAKDIIEIRTGKRLPSKMIKQSSHSFHHKDSLGQRIVTAPDGVIHHYFN